MLYLVGRCNKPQVVKHYYKRRKF